MTVVQRDVNFNEDKSMRFSLERELQITLEEEILDRKKEIQEVMKQPQMEEQRGGRVEKSNQVEPSSEDRKRTREVETLMQDARENVGAPSNLQR